MNTIWTNNPRIIQPMKIKDILKEDTSTMSPYDIYHEITSKQLNALYRLSKYDTDPEDENALDPFDDELSKKTHDTLDDLLDMQLINSAYELTPLGKVILKRSYTELPSDRKDAMSKDTNSKSAAKNRKGRPETVELPVVELEDDEDSPSDLDADESDVNFEQPGKPRKERVKSLRKDDFESFDKDDVKNYDPEDGEYKWD